MKKPLTKYLSDEALLVALQNNDPTAFEALYRNYYRMVAKQVSDFSRADIIAEDIFQETLMILVDKLRNPDFALSAKLGTFLFAIARNLILKKTGKKTELLPGESPISAVEDQFEQDDFEQRKMWEDQLSVVAGHLELLDERCRQVLKMSFYERCSQANIAETLGYSESFVKVKKFRCLDALRQRVQAHPLFQKPPK